MTLSVILPCYHPPEGWEGNIVRVYTDFVATVGVATELIIVLDGEHGAGTERAESTLKAAMPSVKILRYPINRGKGFAIRQGVEVALGELIIYTDIDFPYSKASMLSIYNCLKNNEADIAIGVKDASYYIHLPAARKFISRCLQLMVRIFLSTPITDTQCGLKGFRKPVKALFLATTIDRYLFDLEFIRNSFRSGKYRIKAIPVFLNEQVHFRKMNYRVLFPEMINFAKLLFKNPN